MGKSRTFDRTDWDGFAGAESWGKDQPLIREGEYFLCVADANGVQISFGEGFSENWWVMYLRFPTQSAARLFVDALPKDLTEGQALALGFAPL